VLCTARRPPLVPGHYHLGLEIVSGHERLDGLDRIASLHIIETDISSTGEAPQRTHGYVFAPAEWTVTRTTAGVTVAGRI
jgi:hypothetical protein